VASRVVVLLHGRFAFVWWSLVGASAGFVASCVDLDALGDGSSKATPPEAGSADDAARDEAKVGPPSDSAVGSSTLCKGTAGPTGVVVGDAGYCIDRTEVTVGQYREFLTARAGDTSDQPPECAWNTTFVPRYGMRPVADNLSAIAWIDYCDARAFCAWAGKRLCGAIQGPRLRVEETNDPSRSAWYHACSHDDDGQHIYPYGNTYDPNACAGEGLESADGGAMPAGSLATCEGGYPGIFDLSGGLREWEDACEPFDASSVDAAVALRCRQRGGAYYDVPEVLKCNHPADAPADDQNGGVGFRCCSP
jgi:formylglycine-generating enzyme